MSLRTWWAVDDTQVIGYLHSCEGACHSGPTGASADRRSGIPIVGLRFSNIMEPDDYRRFPSFWRDPRLRKWNLWGYVDVRDVAQSCRLGLEAPVQGAEVFVIAAADTVMPQPNRELLAAVFPMVPLREGTGDYETLLSIGKARRVLGYTPQYSWRNHIAATPSEESKRQD